MINDETIKSLYDDKPTLLEWLKRVEAQLEELKKVTNFDKLTANNIEVKEGVTAKDLEAKRVNGTTANFVDGNFTGDVSVNGKFLVGGNPTSKAIYVHKISWQYVSTLPNVYLYYLSLNPLPYDSMADIFSHKNDTNLSYSELVEFMGWNAIIRFTGSGGILSCVTIQGAGEQVTTTALNPSMLLFNKDEVVGNWR